MKFKFTDRKFIDALRLYMVSGSGGNGIPKCGSIGGQGGDIYIQAAAESTLEKLSKMYPNKQVKAASGEDGRTSRLLGDSGEDTVINAPVGIIIENDLKHEIANLNEVGDRVLVSKGGDGGGSLNGFIGTEGERRHLKLVLKLIADVGLVGFPNAGKSTLLTAISKAKPKIANYPFTTLHPNLGKIVYPDTRQITMADLPGLIEGAWCNKGMGHSFLRHVERTRMLLFVVDIEGFRLSPEYPQRSPFENVLLLNRELELYKPALVKKPCMLAVNKMDKPGARRKFEKLLNQLENVKEEMKKYPDDFNPETFVKFDSIIPMSAKKEKKSIENLKEATRKLLDEHDKAETEIEANLVNAQKYITNSDEHMNKIW